MDHPNNPYAPPGSYVKDIQLRTDGPELASRGARLLAVLIDGVILMVLSMVLGLVFAVGFGGLMAMMPGAAFFLSRLGGIVFGLGTLAIFLGLNGYFLVTRGQTIGKMIIGIRIVRPDGSAPDWLKLLGVRYGLFWVLQIIPIVGFLIWLVDVLMIFRESKRCLHDDAAGTIVIKIR
ncbi:MAG: RDD family protein [Burkholderiales bacterium]